MSVSELSRILDICYQTTQNYVYEERCPTLINAIKIVRATKGQVTFEELVPKHMEPDLRQFVKKTDLL